MRKAFWNFIFKLVGWKIIGNGNDYKKCIFLVAPHTSNWDFPIGLGVKGIQGFKTKFMIKKSWLDKPIIGSWFKAIGGVGVDRTKNTKVADQIVEFFNKHDEFRIAIEPEGTRAYNPRWKTGFWHISKAANIPVIPTVMDFATKTVTFHKPFPLTENKAADIEVLKDIYRKAKGRHPEKGVIE